MKQAVTCLVFLLTSGLCFASVTISANLVDQHGSPIRFAYLEVQLVDCGFNIPSVPGSLASIVVKDQKFTPSQLPATIYGNNEITCGNSYSTLYHITAWRDSSTKIAGDYNYDLCSTTSNCLGAATPSWNLAQSQPFTGTPPPPGYYALFGNAILSQYWRQPAGTTGYFVGAFDFSGATVTGLSGGGGGSGGSGAPNEAVSFTNALSVSLATSFNTSNLVYQCWDGATPANAIYPASASFAQASSIITFTFSVNQTGYCAVNGASGGGSGGGGGSNLASSNTWTGTNAFTGNMTCHAIGSERCVDANNSANWAGPNATAWIASAVSDCAATSCVVKLYPGLTGFTLPANLPDGVTVWDMHDDGRLMIYTNPTDNPTGSPGGIGVNMGYNTSTGGCWPTVGPGSNNIVAGYFCASSNGGLQAWGINPLGDLPTSSPDANIWSIESDIGIFCILPCSTRNSQYAGIDQVNAGNIPPTFAFRAFANTNGPTAGYKTGFLADGVINTAYATQSADTGLGLTESVSASGFPQIVSTNATPGPPGNHVHIGQYVSVDSGVNHEDVLATNLTGAPYSLTGTFTKSHSSGAPITFYTANRVWDPFDFVTRLTPYHLCNLQAWNAANASVFCGWAVNDPNGVERASEWFNATGQHVYGDVGTTGWFWYSQGGSPIASLTDGGIFTAQGEILGSGTGGSATGIASLTYVPGAFSGLPACAAGNKGQAAVVTDSSTAVFNATITGGGANVVFALCNGTNWTAH